MIPPDHIHCPQCNAPKYCLFNRRYNKQQPGEEYRPPCALYKKGQYVFTTQGYPVALYCINKGKIKITHNTFDGTEQIVKLAKDGDILGYQPLVMGERYRFSAVALEDCSVCIIEKDYFLEAIKTDNELLIDILKKSCNDLSLLYEHVVSLSKKNVRERMAEMLVLLSNTYGFTGDDKTLNVVLTREEIAGYIGTSKESAIRLLSEFNTDGIVELSRSRIKILNLPKLVKTANPL